LKVASHQPCFLPWAGFFHKLASCDVFVFSNGTQYVRGDYHNRVPFMGGWLTAPVEKAPTGTPLNQIRYAPGALAAVGQRLQAELLVKRYPHHDRIEPIVRYLETTEDRDLVAVNVAMIGAISGALGIRFRKIVLDGNPATEPTTMLRLKARLERHVPEFTYLAGAGSRSYLTRAFGHPYLFQDAERPAPTDTVLQLIAQHEDPLAFINDTFFWTSP
jgi:hypothetical protein